jgi:U32 family peptidase
MKRPEIVSPAGNPEKLRFAVDYGADAVYFGGEMLNLRENADNFSLDDIRESVALCTSRGIRSVFLLNSFLHESDITGAEEFIGSLKSIPFDAVMISDPGMLGLIKKHKLACEIHLSTQMSTLNHLSIEFWQSQGVTRIVMARETTLDEIRMIRKHTDADIEIFAHGALCIAYSGRCLLSRYMSGRDSNQGNCSHPCRWEYTLVEEKRPGEYFDIIESDQGTEILSSKDLCLIERIPEYIDAGVNAFKIEGRMKSVYYTANVTRVYKSAVETYCSGGDFAAQLPLFKEELDLVSHRPFTDDLFNEFKKTFEPIPYVNKSTYYGNILSSADSGLAEVRTSNPFRPGDTLEMICPLENGKIMNDKATALTISENGKETDMARPEKIVTVQFDKPVRARSILRKRNA